MNNMDQIQERQDKLKIIFMIIIKKLIIQKLIKMVNIYKNVENEVIMYFKNEICKKEILPMINYILLGNVTSFGRIIINQIIGK